MNANRWEKLKTVFGEVLELRPEERGEFIDRNSPDGEFRSELRALLDAHGRPGSFMEGVAVHQVAESIADRKERLLVGQVISHYKVIGFLGAGGMGKVYLALDTTLNRKVALKLLSSDFPNRKELLARFEREACAASALNHPNIITVHETFVEDGLHVISTEFVDGVTLRDKMSGGPIPIDETIDISTQVASALLAAHSAGIVHRDVKPENVMIRSDGLVKVLDFGLAKSVDENDRREAVLSGRETRALPVTDPRVVLGTVNYISPEQARGRAADQRSDIFSFGVLLYEMLSGHLPFSGETAAAKVEALLNEDPEALPDCPPELARIVSKALRKTADSRYQNMCEVRDDLKALASTGRLGQTAPARRTSPRRSVVVAAVSFVLFLIAGFSYYARRPATVPEPIGTIAVLKFANQTGDPDLDFLSDGFAESLIGRLSRFQALKVYPASAVERFKGLNDRARLVSELGVQALISGTVTRRADTLIINVEMDDLRDGRLLWGERYERSNGELRATQAEIADAVIERLGLREWGSGNIRLTRAFSNSEEAYQSYLRGQYFLNRLNQGDLEKAVYWFNRAIELDPNFALAYVGVSDAFSSSLNSYPPLEYMPKAKDAALKAISLDSDLAEAHAAHGKVLLLYDYDRRAAEKELALALRLNPNSARVHQGYATLLISLGKFDEAIAEFRKALELAPLSLQVNWSFGLNLNNARRYDDALVQMKRTLELEPNLLRGHLALAMIYQSKGNYAESVESYARAQELAGRPDYAGALREVYLKEGMTGFWRYVTDERTRVCTPYACTAYTLASHYAQLGEKDKAFAELEEAYRTRNYQLYVLKVDPRFDPLRDDPRYGDFLRKIGLED